MGRDEERRASAEHARAALEAAGRPAQAGGGFVRPPSHAIRRVPEPRRLQRHHHPEAQPPLAGALRPPAHPGGIGPDPLEPQAELRPLVRHRQIDRFAVQGPRSEPHPRPRGKACERAGAVGVGAHVDPQPRRQVHERGGMVRVPGIEAPPRVERLPAGPALRATFRVRATVRVRATFRVRAAVRVRHVPPRSGRQAASTSAAVAMTTCSSKRGRIDSSVTRWHSDTELATASLTITTW